MWIQFIVTCTSVSSPIRIVINLSKCLFLYFLLWSAPTCCVIVYLLEGGWHSINLVLTFQSSLFSDQGLEDITEYKRPHTDSYALGKYILGLIKDWKLKNLCLHYSAAPTSTLRFTVQNKDFLISNLYVISFHAFLPTFIHSRNIIYLLQSIKFSLKWLSSNR